MIIRPEFYGENKKKTEQNEIQSNNLPGRSPPFQNNDLYNK